MAQDLSWPQGHDKIVLDSVDSTLNEAQRRASAGLLRPLWILAHHQTQARGRRGRPWSMPAGNFACTLVLPTQDAPDRIALRSFVAALALFDACVTATGRAEGLSLKWPNDVLLNGGKLSGILLESAGQGAELSYLAIGIGVNLKNAPGADGVEARALRPVSLLSETGAQVTPEEFLPPLARAYARYETQFLTYGFAPIRDAWLARAARLGEVVTARTGRGETTGTFETLDEAGNLVLLTGKGRVSIPAADIFF